jgi:uncharacterized Fe-S cluster-containing radical SAM superfamily protein
MKAAPIQRAKFLRSTLERDNNVLVVDFSDTLQGQDTSKVIDLMPNVSTGEYVFRGKVNVKEIDPIAAAEYGKPFFDVRGKTDLEIQDFLKQAEFDFPLWFKNDNDFSMSRVLDYNPPFILQIAGCNFHDGSDSGGCWYCFVDDTSNDGVVGSGKTFLGINDTIDSMVDARAKVKDVYAEHDIDLNMRVLRISGGEPTIALDWILNLWREINSRGLDFVGQIDSNLSTGYLVDSFEKQGIFEPNTLQKLAEYPIKVLTAIKGTDEENLQSNVQASIHMETQEYSLIKFLESGFDIYPQMYNPNPDTLDAYLSHMDSRIENFSLKVHIGPLNLYGPNIARLTVQANMLGRDPEQHIAEKTQEWDSNFANGNEVLNSYLQRNYGVGYKEMARPDVELTLKR